MANEFQFTGQISGNLPSPNPLPIADGKWYLVKLFWLSNKMVSIMKSRHPSTDLIAVRLVVTKANDNWIKVSLECESNKGEFVKVNKCLINTNSPEYIWIPKEFTIEAPGPWNMRPGEIQTALDAQSMVIY